MESMSSPNLGNVLMTRKPDIKFQILLGALAIGAFIGGCSFLFLAFTFDPATYNKKQDLDSTTSTLFAFVAFILAFSLGGLAYVEWKTILCCHQHGISKSTPLSNREIRYENLESMSFNLVEEYYNGIYLGTRYFFNFIATQDAGGGGFYFSIVQRKDVDQDLENLRDYISAYIAKTLDEKLQRDGLVLWTPDIRILKNGIEYHADKTWKFLPIERIAPLQIAQGTFLLRDSTINFPVLQVPFLVPNFFPGLVLLQKKMAEYHGV